LPCWTAPRSRAGVCDVGERAEQWGCVSWRCFRCRTRMPFNSSPPDTPLMLLLLLLLPFGCCCCHSLGEPLYLDVAATLAKDAVGEGCAVLTCSWVKCCAVLPEPSCPAQHILNRASPAAHPQSSTNQLHMQPAGRCAWWWVAATAWAARTSLLRWPRRCLTT
jgi:hypothetical protein